MEQITYNKDSKAHIAKISNQSIVGVINKETKEKGYLAKGHIGGDCEIFTKEGFLFGQYDNRHSCAKLCDTSAILLCSDKFDLFLFETLNEFFQWFGAD